MQDIALDHSVRSAGSLGRPHISAGRPQKEAPHEAYLLVLSIVISGITSHAPSGVRHFSIFHGRVVETGDQL